VKYVQIVVTATYQFPFKPGDYMGVDSMFDSEGNPKEDAVVAYEKEAVQEDPQGFFESCDFGEQDVEVTIVDKPAPEEHPVGGTK